MKPFLRSVLFVLALLSAMATSAENCDSGRTVETLVPGLTHTLLCRGEMAKMPSYRIVVGTFSSQTEASRTLDRLHAKDLSALPTTDGQDYRIVTPSYLDREQAEVCLGRLSKEGFGSSLSIEKIGQDLTNPDGPWRIHLLEADPERIGVRVAHGFDMAIGIETTTSLARRHGAVAAINGGYYRMQGLLAGDSQGVLKMHGALLSEPDRGRAASGFFVHEGITRSVFGRLSFSARILLQNGGQHSLDGLNRSRGRAEAILYTPEFHRTTLTAPDGMEVVVEHGRIAAIREHAGSTEIPATGFVLSLGQDRAEGLIGELQVGQTLSVSTELRPLLPDPHDDWRKAEFVLGGGPLLIWRGKRIEEWQEESISRVFSHARHPRTAVGKRADGTLLMVTVDGRQPTESVGMSLPELTDLLLELEAVFAVNLDGGGSTTMTIEGRTVNTPSSTGGDRANGDAILLFERR